MSILLVVLGLILLVIGGEYLVRSSVALSFKLKISKLVIGLTVVSFATSAPELLVSLQAALNGYSDIALGNVIGSNIANIGLVLGITALISPLAINKDFYKFNWPVMMLVSIMLYVFLKSGKELNFLEGMALFVCLIIFLVVLIRNSRKDAQMDLEEVDDKLQAVSSFKITLWMLIGAAALYFGSEWLVRGAKDIAESLGVSQRVISVTMVAVGTSIPELAASVIAALKKEKAISLGNLIGSNIFNITSVLGITAMIQPIAVKDERLLTSDIFWMLGFAFVLIPLVFLHKRFQLSKLEGLILFVGYALFVFMAFV
ncbi:MAG: calcium/sodium antiporter [Flavobacteriaceae bacterium]|nr:calcium/sodium antiporter [Mangrovimonas sp.]MCB0469138.1 calcium/sodium antiporter [Flavobacteriaceae bacterium]MCB0427294.1 calcium/sodium antiporter [Mangrovimonas sp.]MCB0433311.1 calcium/sodium antiporter [Mangrovimonas sp.]MCB0436431.1 calcium/sodium antiporter [Mangrovimonas sp.]